MIKHDVGRVLLKLETVQQQAEAETEKDTTITLTDSERDEALALLNDPNLLTRILNDFDHPATLRKGRVTCTPNPCF